LTNNLLYDISQTGIPTDKVDSELIVHPRKWNIQGIKKFMLFIGPISSIFDYATFFLMLYFFNCKAFSAVGATAATKSYSESLFHTGWFVESLLTQTMIVHIIRTRKIPFLQSAASGALFLTTLAAMFIAGWLPYSPAADLFGLVPLPISYWIWIAGFLLTYAVLTHIVTRWYHNKYGVS
jgi:Mg2+-importing ATPase